MKIIQRKKRKSAAKRDMKKESIFKHLTKLLGDYGYTVRREALKQGHGWRVLSGSCVAAEQDMIFVDKRLSQDEQISFLVTKIVSLGLQPTAEQLAHLPEKITNQIQVEVIA